MLFKSVNRKSQIIILLMIIALLGACEQAAEKDALGTAVADKPMNVIFILADDLGWADTTLYGHTSLYQTPNLERACKARYDLYAGLFSQPTLFADTFQYPDRPDPGAYRVNHAGMSYAQTRSESRGCQVGFAW